MNRVRAKLTLTGIENAGKTYSGKTVDDQPEYGIGGTLIFEAVYDGDDPTNEQWAAATPYAELKMRVDNPAAFGFFKPGRKYFVDFSEVEPSD